MPAFTVSPSAVGPNCLKAAVIYLLLGLALGMYMGASESFVLRPVHTHLNLLGWATLALAGLVYSVFPQTARSRLAAIHFWLHNVSMPVMMAALAAMLLGRNEAAPVLVAAQFPLVAGIVAFAANVFLHVGKTH
ncbi:cbb3-type cytochrome c oxidase subunit I [Methylogaea oryzae]|uniref:Cytochrome-c oxidase n=2 Tax=Methylogaea oryzae TaxID=1295382 RepID=A0A8D4VQJ8_9GAMM|nr:cbb3-type cytochrome c oxidase subunit I [Methylogaea oryzae]BBL70600.1 hypothetical protein MoryE10_12060 [Methylogaea oryzae]